MRASVACCLLILPFVSGCFGPQSDSGEPAPNYNPAAEREDYPEPAGSDSRAPADDSNDPPVESSNDSVPFSNGSGRIVKAFQGLTVEKFRKAYEENDGSDEASESGETVASGHSSE